MHVQCVSFDVAAPCVHEAMLHNVCSATQHTLYCFMCCSASGGFFFLVPLLPFAFRCFLMPPKMESPQAKSARYQLKSAELTIKAESQIIIATMRQAPSCITKIKKLLKDLKYIDAMDSIVATESTACRLLVLNDEDGPEGVRLGEPSGNDVLAFDLSADIPHESAQTSSGEFLTFLLEQLEPVTCSKHSLKALLKKGQRKVPKPMLLELLEFICDWPPDGDWIALGSVGILLEHLGEKNNEQGRRARDLKLPFTWAEVGVFSFRLVDGKAFLADRYTHKEVAIDDDSLCDNYSEDMKDYVILKNYSRSRATLQQCGRLATISCGLWLPWETLPRSAPKRLALSDGVLDDDSAGARPSPAKVQRVANEPLKVIKPVSSVAGARASSPKVHASSSTTLSSSSTTAIAANAVLAQAEQLDVETVDPTGVAVAQDVHALREAFVSQELELCPEINIFA